MKALLIGIIVIAFLGVLGEIAEELNGIRKCLEKILRSVSIYEIKDNS